MKSFGVKANIFPLEDKDAFRREVAESAILANGTSLGMKPLDQLSIIDDTLDVLREDLIVTDVVYNPQKQSFLHKHRKLAPKPLTVLNDAVARCTCLQTLYW